MSVTVTVTIVVVVVAASACFLAVTTTACAVTVAAKDPEHCYERMHARRPHDTVMATVLARRK
jgi:hypothetical protein